MQSSQSLRSKEPLLPVPLIALQKFVCLRNNIDILVGVMFNIISGIKCPEQAYGTFRDSIRDSIMDNYYTLVLDIGREIGLA
jgi:hypothetical protein